MKLKCNCCDGVYNSIDVHFTSYCDNNCAHCIDKKYMGIDVKVPDIDAIADTIIKHAKDVDDVLFLGGEPCLFLDELEYTIMKIKRFTNLKVYITTAMPKTCYDHREEFEHILSIVDGLNISAQHHNEKIADEIRRSVSLYDRQEFYNSLPHKEKIRINLNIVKPYLCTKEDIVECLTHYDKMGFDSIKLSEIQHGEEYFVSFEKLFDINLGSPFSDGCQTYLNMKQIIPGFKTPVLLKRSCFMCEETLKATPGDFVKAISKIAIRPSNHYGVVYEDGSIKKGWV